MEKGTERIQHQVAVLKATLVNGYLLKKSTSLLSRYRKRYFIISAQHNQLVYYSDQKKKKCRNHFFLSNIYEIQKLNDLQFSFFYKLKAKEYIFKCETEEQNNKWIKSFKIITAYIQSLKKQTPQLKNHLISLSKQSAQVSNFQTNIKNTFSILGLQKINRQFHEGSIKNRIIVHIYNNQCVFMVSCKSLVKESVDDIILDKQYISFDSNVNKIKYEPQISGYEFNVLYHYNIKTEKLSKIVNAEDITGINLINKTLQINSFTIEFTERENQFIIKFVEKLKHSILVGSEVRKHEKLFKASLKQNVDALVQLHFKMQNNRLHKQYIHMKLEDEYISILALDKFSKKQHKKNYDKFEILINHLIEQIQNSLNAFEVKPMKLRQLVSIFVNFYEEKVFKLWRLFWGDNYEKMSVKESISMTNLSHKYYIMISPFLIDKTRSLNGIKIMRDIYLKMILTGSIEVYLKSLLRTNQIITQNNLLKTNISHLLINKLFQEFKVISENYDYKEPIEESQRLLIEATTILLTNQLQTKATFHHLQQKYLISNCNDILDYKQIIESWQQKQYQKQKLDETMNIIMKFLRMTTKNIYSAIYQKEEISKIGFNLNAQYFTLNLERYVQVSMQYIKSIKYLDSKVNQGLMQRMIDDLNLYYYKAILSVEIDVKDPQNSYHLILQKLQTDIEASQKLLQGIAKQRVLNLLNCLKLFFGSQFSEEFVTDIFTQLKFDIFAEDFKQADFKILMKLKQWDYDKKIEQVLDRIDFPLICFDTDHSIIQSDVDSSKSLFASIRPRRGTQQKSEAQLLMNMQTDYQGYLQMKKVISQKTRQQMDCRLTQSSDQQPKKRNYASQYFKLSSGCLMWFSNPNSSILIGSILLDEIKQITSNAPGQFSIDLKNDEAKYMFKTCAASTSSKWIQQLNSSITQSSNFQTPPNLLKQSSQLLGLFEQQQNKVIKNRASMISNYRNHELSRLPVIDEDSSLSPIKKSSNKKISKKFSLGQLFGCVKLE